MTDKFNTVAGWALFAGIVALGASIVSGELFHSERPEKMGYPIEGVVLEGEGGDAAPEQPIAVYLATADAAKGEQAFKKCASCHNITPGGARLQGPALYGIMGDPIAGRPGFDYSASLKSKGGTWDWEAMSAWIKRPKDFADKTKMSFPGMSDPQERAHLLAFMNSRDNAPLPLPAAPAGGAEQTDDAAAKAGSGVGDGAQKGENEPVLTEQQAAKSPSKNIGGEGAAKVTGPSGVATNN